MARRRSSGITSLGFNQDQGCFTCCLKTGLRVYNVEPLVEKAHYSKEELGDVSLCEMVFRTNWLLVVKARRPCSLMLLDDQQRAFKAEVLFKSPIRALRARKDKVAVVLSSSIQVLALPSLSRVALMRTRLGARPLCALASEPSAPHLLAAPAHRKGSLQLLDVTRAVKGAHSSSPAVMGCHQTELVCLSLSANGARLATASERGTIIRVWDTATKQMLHELRRGSDYADVYCINFNQSGSLVCCVSDKGTLHVWAARGAWPHLAAARASVDTRALCAFTDDNTAVLICEDGTFHKFTFAAEGNCHRSDFEYFLQVGDDDEFLQ
ncbi:WD repeat domain phosphoinositide-interacting protein 4 isoform X1 [Helicoverpa armigera]|uniref:WD repeat domain phosphoinositide-interacting protein 4-like isoform X1 n=2 Tax=Helicoverpa zea TaxID=7113 RepID=UPI000B367868|nr:WD repeat domain phosphoinositide-interacting protein 4-like isoform X1 [Helicoverpa zea]XP_049697578.1 WD repeat domain phosphoinositide-interacting protein 4 isoform X1 [Helicoverpa armigera]